jgi:hypothetical protein
MELKLQDRIKKHEFPNTPDLFENVKRGMTRDLSLHLFHNGFIKFDSQDTRDEVIYTGEIHVIHADKMKEINKVIDVIVRSAYTPSIVHDSVQKLQSLLTT